MIRTLNVFYCGWGEDWLLGETVCTKGTVTEYKGRKQVEVQYASSINIQ